MGLVTRFLVEEEGIRGIHPSLRESQGSRDVTETIDQFADELTLSFQPPVFGPFSNCLRFLRIKLVFYALNFTLVYF